MPWSPGVRAILPTQCELCRRWSADALCEACTARFAAPRPRCSRCALPTGTPLPHCGECLHDAPPFARGVAAVDYGYPWDGLVAALKFHGRADLAPTLAKLMLRAWALAGHVTATHPPGLADMPSLVLPVPLSDQRLRERGYNQAWELARRVAVGLGVASRAEMLIRIGQTPAQVESTRNERLANLRAAFAPAPGAGSDLEGQHVLLVDDVMTTGATVRQASAALLRAGAAAVSVLVLARTDAPNHA